MNKIELLEREQMRMDLPDFIPGDTVKVHVKIKEGPFENFDAIVDEVFPEKGVVKVIVNIFSRATPVELEYWQVERI
mgnify:CR=1 FL=1